MDNPSNNFFDELQAYNLEEAEKQVREDRAKGERLDYLIHRVFAQNDSAKDLLKAWEETLILTPTARPGDDMIQVGIMEGYKSFIRNIKLTVRKVEGETND